SAATEDASPYRHIDPWSHSGWSRDSRSSFFVIAAGAGAATEPVELFYWRLLAHQSSTGAPSAPPSTTAPATGHRSAGSRSRWRPRRWRDTGRHQAASWAYSRDRRSAIGDRRSAIAEPPMLALP